jgi:hypothetical protein
VLVRVGEDDCGTNGQIVDGRDPLHRRLAGARSTEVHPTRLQRKRHENAVANESSTPPPQRFNLSRAPVQLVPTRKNAAHHFF